MNAGPDALAGRDANGDEEHGDKEQSDGEWDFVNGNVASHFHAVVSNFQIDACGIKITKDMLQLPLHPGVEMVFALIANLEVPFITFFKSICSLTTTKI